MACSSFRFGYMSSMSALHARIAHEDPIPDGLLAVSPCLRLVQHAATADEFVVKHPDNTIADDDIVKSLFLNATITQLKEHGGLAIRESTFVQESNFVAEPFLEQCRAYLAEKSAAIAKTADEAVVEKPLLWGIVRSQLNLQKDEAVEAQLPGPGEFPTYWIYRLTEAGGAGIGMRSAPEYPGDRTGARGPYPSEEAVVVERVTKVIDGVEITFLKLWVHPDDTSFRAARSGGWIFDRVPSDTAPSMELVREVNASP